MQRKRSNYASHTIAVFVQYYLSISVKDLTVALAQRENMTNLDLDRICSGLMCS